MSIIPARRLSARLILAIAFLLSLVALVPLTASAQEEVGVKVTPSLVEEVVDPGIQKSYTVRVENRSTIRQTLYPLVRDITGIGEGGQPIFASEGERSDYGLSSWVEFTERSLDLAPGTSAEVHFVVRVPQNVSPGAHVGSITIASEPPSETGIGSAVSYEVGSILSLRVSGDIVQDTRIREFSVDALFFKRPDVEFSIRVENLGNVFVRPQGFVDIVGMRGKKVDTLPVNEGGASVFPKSDRRFSTHWSSEDFHIGKYTAELSLSVEGEGGMQTLLATTEFWVIPLDVVLPVLGVALLALFAVYVVLRLYVRKQIARATGGVMLSPKGQEAASLSRLSVVLIAVIVALIVGLLILFFAFA